MIDPCLPSNPPWYVPHVSMPHRIIHRIHHVSRHALHHVAHVAQVIGPIPDKICQFAFKSALVGIMALAPPSAGPTPTPPAPHVTKHTAGPAAPGALGGGGSGIIYSRPAPIQATNDVWGPFVVTPGGSEILPDVPTNPSRPVVPPDHPIPEPATLAIMAPPLAVLFALAALRAGGGPLPARAPTRLNAAGP